jgi:hypothetical protein
LVFFPILLPLFFYLVMIILHSTYFFLEAPKLQLITKTLK